MKKQLALGIIVGLSAILGIAAAVGIGRETAWSQTLKLAANATTGIQSFTNASPVNWTGIHNFVGVVTNNFTISGASANNNPLLRIKSDAGLPQIVIEDVDAVDGQEPFWYLQSANNGSAGRFYLGYADRTGTSLTGNADILVAKATGLDLYGTLTADTLTVTNHASVGSLAVVTNATVGGTLGVTGASTLSSLTVTNDTTIGGLTVNTNITVSGLISVAGTSTMGALTITNAATIGSLINNGTSSLVGAVTADSITVTNGTTLNGTLSVAGASTLDSATVTNNLTLQNTTASLPLFTDATKVAISKSVADTLLALGIQKWTATTAADGTVTNTFATAYSVAPVVVTTPVASAGTTNRIATPTTTNVVITIGEPSIVVNGISIGTP